MTTLSMDFDLAQDGERHAFRTVLTSTQLLQAINQHFDWFRTRAAKEERAAQPLRTWTGYAGEVLKEDLESRLTGELLWVLNPKHPHDKAPSNRVSLSFDNDHARQVALKSGLLVNFVNWYIPWLRSLEPTLVTWAPLKAQVAKQTTDMGLQGLVRP